MWKQIVRVFYRFCKWWKLYSFSVQTRWPSEINVVWFYSIFCTRRRKEMMAKNVTTRQLCAYTKSVIGILLLLLLTLFRHDEFSILVDRVEKCSAAIYAWQLLSLLILVCESLTYMRQSRAFFFLLFARFIFSEWDCSTKIKILYCRWHGGKVRQNEKWRQNYREEKKNCCTPHKIGLCDTVNRQQNTSFSILLLFFVINLSGSFFSIVRL